MQPVQQHLCMTLLLEFGLLMALQGQTHAAELSCAILHARRGCKCVSHQHALFVTACKLKHLIMLGNRKVLTSSRVSASGKASHSTGADSAWLIAFASHSQKCHHQRKHVQSWHTQSHSNSSLSGAPHQQCCTSEGGSDAGGPSAGQPSNNGQHLPGS